MGDGPIPCHASVHSSGPLVAPPAQPNELRLNDHNSVAAPIFDPTEYNLLTVEPSLFGRPQTWEDTFSPLEQGAANTAFMTQSRELNEGRAQSQLAHSHLRVPQVPWGSNREPIFQFNDQDTLQVSITDFIYPHAAYAAERILEHLSTIDCPLRSAPGLQKS